MSDWSDQKESEVFLLVKRGKQDNWDKYESLDPANPFHAYGIDIFDGKHKMFCGSSGVEARCVYSTDENPDGCVMDLRSPQIDTTQSGEYLITHDADPTFHACADALQALEWGRLIAPVNYKTSQKSADASYMCFDRPSRCWSDKHVTAGPSCALPSGRTDSDVQYCIRRDGDQGPPSYKSFHGDPDIQIADTASPKPDAHLLHLDSGSYSLLIGSDPPPSLAVWRRMMSTRAWTADAVQRRGGNGSA